MNYAERVHIKLDFKMKSLFFDVFIDFRGILNIW